MLATGRNAPQHPQQVASEGARRIGGDWCKAAAQAMPRGQHHRQLREQSLGFAHIGRVIGGGGIDIGVGMGTPIAAASSGTVFYSGEMGGYGLVVLIDHGNGMVTLYAHQSQLIAVKGQSVSRGTTVGLVGSTGHSTGPHLHFEVRLGANGNAVDPMGYLG